MLPVPPLAAAATAQLVVMQLTLAAADAAITTGSYVGGGSLNRGKGIKARFH